MQTEPATLTEDRTAKRPVGGDDPAAGPLEVLFEETLALAGRLRKNARQAHQEDNLSAAGRGVLLALHLSGPSTVPQLAGQRSTSRQNIQVLVNRLAATGFVEAVTNPHHKRSELIRLTRRGEQLLQSANQREAAMLARLMPDLSGGDVLAAARLLRKTRELLSGGKPSENDAAERPANITPSSAVRDKRKILSPSPAPQAAAISELSSSVDATVEEETDELPVTLL